MFRTNWGIWPMKPATTYFTVTHVSLFTANVTMCDHVNPIGKTKKKVKKKKKKLPE
jgi:hypothetical protein